MKIDRYRVDGGTKVSLKDHDTRDTGAYNDKADAAEDLQKNVERYLERNGTTILKFFLHVSRKEQKQRFLERIDMPEKNWKFSLADVKERRFWKEYMAAYEEMLQETSTPWAPWYIIPADRKWYTRALVAEIINTTLESMNLSYPVLTGAQKADLAKAKEMLLAEE